MYGIRSVGRVYTQCVVIDPSPLSNQQPTVKSSTSMEWIYGIHTIAKTSGDEYVSGYK